MSMSSESSTSAPSTANLAIPNLRLLHHRSGILLQKRALESDICRHYTAHDTFIFMASVETLKEVHELTKYVDSRWVALPHCSGARTAETTVGMPSNG